MDSKKNREKQIKEYIQTKLDKIFLPLGVVLKKEQPDNLNEFTLDWIREIYGNRASKNENERQELEFLRMKVPSLEKDIEEGSSQNIPAVKYHFNQLEPPMIQIIPESDSESDSESEGSVDENFILPDLSEMKTLTVEQALTETESNPSRCSISAEVYGKYNKKASFKPVFIQKDKEICERLKKRLSGHWMFASLVEEDKKTLVDTMREESYQAGDIIIKEGDRGNSLYLVESGTYNCVKENSDGTQTLLKVYEEGEMFGELALIYNCPRTATIISNNDECSVFSLDRQTFNYIVNASVVSRNERYMKLLGDVPILKTLDQYEKTKILDSCRHVEYDEDECIISEGDNGEEFFILLEGEAFATKILDDKSSPTLVKEYASGDYFGERALLNNTIRAASIIAKTHIKCLVLDRDVFKRLLGPIEHVLKRNMKIYINYIEE